MRKRFDPSYLEPKDGDFASFVEKINQKSVQELKLCKSTMSRCASRLTMS